jgi:8-amino-3,8-dideoxy-alpha-D-manno-octulosonate transaminase
MAANLEREFAKMMGGKYTLGVTSGTAALEVALGALGIGPGDEVILAAWSWISCFTSIVRVGARPVMAEVDENFCIAAGEIKRLTTPRTKLVTVVHYQGVPGDMDRIGAEAKAAGLKVLEDCAQSVGATYKGRRVGRFSDIACYSFQHNKFMTTGEGGMVMTDDPILYERAVRMHDIGQVRPIHQQVLGGKTQVPSFSGSQFRMAELTAAVGLAQLRKLDGIKDHCRTLSARILEKAKGLKGITPRPIPDPSGDLGFEVYLFLPTEEKTAEFRKKLNALNVNCRQGTGTYSHYAREYCQTGHAHSPAASPFKDLKPWPAPGYRAEDFPRTQALIERFIAIPIGALYTEADADYIGDAIRHVHAQVSL